MAVRTAQPRSPKVPEIRKGDTVVVLAGKDAGKRGTVERVIRRTAAPSAARSVFRRGSSRRRRERRRRGPQHRQAPHQAAPVGRARATASRRCSRAGSSRSPSRMPVSKVMLVCTNCGKPTRIAHATLDTGRRVRVCRHCGEQLEVKS